MKKGFIFLLFSIFFQSYSYAVDIDFLFYQSNSYFEGLNGKGKNPRLGIFFILKIIEYADQKLGNQELNQKISAKAYKALADSFYSGDGVDQSYDLALHYYKKSAKKKYPPAFFNIAAIYKEQGHYKKAKIWIKKYIKLPDAHLKKQAMAFLQSLKIVN